MDLSNEEINHRTGQVIDAAMKVHTALGPGLLESSYQACLTHELLNRGIAVSTQYAIRSFTEAYVWKWDTALTW